MKVPLLFAFVTLCAALSPAEVAGTWEGVLRLPAQPVRFVLHITGDDSNLRATDDSPDQGVWGTKIDSITLSGPVLTFEINQVAVKFVGNLMSDGTIAGTFTQRGAAFPLVLARSAGVRRIPLDTTSSLTADRYHNNWTRIEFNVPEKFTYVETETRSNPGGMQADFTVAGAKSTRIAVWMNKRTLYSERIPGNLTAQIPLKIGRRGGPAANYTIPENSIQKLQIGGEEAIRATAYYPDRGKKMVELLAWISTENSIAHFYAIMPADEVDMLQPAFDQMVMSAQVP